MATRGWEGAMMRTYGAVDHDLLVLSKTMLAPHFVRIRMHSATLFEDIDAGPTAFVRLWVPDQHGAEREYQRGYTLANYDEQSGEFDLDFVLHEPAGPASHWAKTVEPGARVQCQVLSSVRFELPEELPEGYLLVGDTASIPAINAILETVPDQLPIEVYLEQQHDEDTEIPVNEHPRARIHWVWRSRTQSLAEAIEVRDWSNWKVWAAPEAGSLKELRKRLVEEFGFPKREVYGRAYWTANRAMGTDREKTVLSPEEQAQASPVAHEPTVPVAQSVTPEPATTPKGRWRSQMAGELFAPIRRQLIVSGILQGIITLVQLVPYILLVELARLLIAGAPAQALWQTGIWFAVVLGAGALLGSALTFWLHQVDARFSAELRHRLLDKLARLPLGWFVRKGSGSVKSVVQDDTLSLHYLITHAIPDAVAAALAPIAVLIYLFISDWRLALILFIPILTYIVLMFIMIVQSGPKIAEAARWAERMNGEASSYLEGQPVLRIFGGAAASSFRTKLDGYIGFLNGWQRPFIAKKTVMDLVTRPSTFLWIILIFGTLFVSTGAAEPVTLLPFLVLGTTFGARLLGIGYGLAGIRDGMQAAQRLAVTLAEPELSTDQVSEVRTEPDTGTSAVVRFTDVTFGYRPSVPVLHDISLELAPGTVTALVGSSGSGKSTLAALLARFYDVQQGAVTVAGRDIRILSTDELYQQLGFVFQNAQLVHGTVRENIALARPDAPLAVIEEAARQAQILERIRKLPQSFDTVLDSGSKLSGGEQQRLTIARAIVADTPILILDEATAFADPESEFLVQQALNHLTARRTVLVIAHRLRTITAADQIVVLDGGRIVQLGTHDALLAEPGRYRELWEQGEAHREGVSVSEGSQKEQQR